MQKARNSNFKRLKDFKRIAINAQIRIFAPLQISCKCAYIKNNVEFPQLGGRRTSAKDHHFPQSDQHLTSTLTNNCPLDIRSGMIIPYLTTVC
jgi:hypothetical protein